MPDTSPTEDKQNADYCGIVEVGESFFDPPDTPVSDELVERLEEAFWHDCADVPDLDTSRHAVRRAIEFALSASPVQELVEMLEDVQPMTGDNQCALPPKGWWCSRGAGHEGPCAAHPTREVADELWQRAEQQQAERAELMPTERDAIVAMCSAYQRLKELGWQEAIYCPKDGTIFDAIEAGSTGIFPCHYTGEWPNGHWWAEDGGDLWPSRPVLFRLRPGGSQ